MNTGFTDEDLNVEDLRRSIGEPTVKTKNGAQSMFQQKDLSHRNKGKRGMQLLMGIGALFVIMFVVILFSPSGGHKSNAPTSSTLQDASIAHPAAASVDGTSNDTQVASTLNANGASNDATTSALNAEMANAPEYRGAYSGKPSAGPSSQPIGAVGESVAPGQSVSADHPVYATTPPLTPAQLRAIEKAKALAQARMQSLRMLGESSYTQSSEASRSASQAGFAPTPAPANIDIPAGQMPPISGMTVLPKNASIAQDGTYLPPNVPNSEATPPADDLVMKTHRYRAPSPFVLDAGSEILIVLDHGINTDADGILVGHVAKDIKVNGQTVVPYWTKVLGTTKALRSSSASRIESTITYFIFPDHSYMPLLGAIGSDPDGTPGFTPSSVNDHRGRVLGAAGITAALSAIPLAIIPNSNNTSVLSMSPSQQFGLMVAENTANAGNQIVQSRAQQTNTLIADPSKVYTITLQQSIPFAVPYQALPPKSGANE